MFQEPPRSPYDLCFSVLGVPVRVHPMFWLVTLLLGLSGGGDPERMICWVAAVFISILVHELGHALTAKAHGWQPRISLHGFGGLAAYQPTYRSPSAQILITLAGPCAGFALAGFILAAVVASGHAVQFHSYVLPVFEPFDSFELTLLVSDLLFVNIFWGLVNLLPIFPLDGGQIARELFGLAMPGDGLRLSLWLSTLCAGLLAVLVFTKLRDQFLGIFFVYLAYNSFTQLQSLFGRGGGFGGGR